MHSPFRVDTSFHSWNSEPIATGWLDVGDGHEIYWEERGAADGVPVVVVHGGPGGDIRPYYKRLLDPASHRGVFFEQRGCGRSRPSGGLSGNNTMALIRDMERLRDHLGIEKWMLLGGSWGSALSLAYAQAHPERVRALVVSGIFLCREEDTRWWWHGARTVFPEVFAARDEFLTPDERDDPRAAFNARIASLDPTISSPAAIMLSHVESQMLDLWPPAPPERPDMLDDGAATASRILSWYDRHDFFLERDQLLRDAFRLAGIPGAIIAGRADICTPPKAAWDLAQAWPSASLTIVAAAGHRWSDELLGGAIIREVARLTDETRKG